MISVWTGGALRKARGGGIHGEKASAAWRPERRVRVFVYLVCACLIGVTVSRLYLARELALRESRITTTNLARSLAEHARATLEAADIVVSGLADRQAAAGADLDALQRVQRHMMERVFTVSRLRGLTMRSADGTLLASAWEGEQLDSGASDALHLEHHRAHFDAGAFLGPPTRDAVTGEWTISVSRRFDGPGGVFGGVAVAVVGLRCLQRFL